MQIYVINLNNKPDRWETMKRQAVDLGLSVKRVPATTPDGLSSGEQTKWETSVNGQRISITEYACALSHRKVWQQIAENAAGGNALVLEDDVVLSEKLPDVLDDIDGQTGWDILRLETYLKEFKVGRRKPVESRHVGFYSLCAGDYGAAAYIISPAAAEKLVSKPTRTDVPVDTWLFDRRANNPPSVRVFQCAPALAVQLHRLNVVGYTVDESSSLESTRAFVRLYRSEAFMRPLPKTKLLRELFRPLFQLESLIYQRFWTPIGEPCEYSGGEFVEFWDNIK